VAQPRAAVGAGAVVIPLPRTRRRR
jgi:hypothetical protein